MNAWSSFAAALYHGLHVATAARVRCIDEGGVEALRGTRPVIIVANHQSHADTPVISMNVPRERRRQLRFLASAARFGGPARAVGIRDRAERWFLHGMAMHAYGAILVGDEHIGLGAFHMHAPHLEMGLPLPPCPRCGWKSVDKQKVISRGLCPARRVYAPEVDEWLGGFSLRCGFCYDKQQSLKSRLAELDEDDDAEEYAL